MRSEVSKKILRETSKETKDRVNNAIEEFLDKKNIEVIKEVRDAINIKSQLEATHRFIRDLEKRSEFPSCPIHGIKNIDTPRVDWSVLQIAMNLAQDYFEGRLVYKEEK